MFRFIVLIFTIFPFTQIVPLNTYNQPYALISAFILLMLFPQAYRELPKVDRVMLVYLLVVGLLLFLVAVTVKVGLREVQYLLAYVSPVIIIPTLVFLIRSNPTMARYLILVGILIWFVVALAQRFFSPDFLVFLASSSEDLGSNIRASGRGQLGLAPEPTHHALHMLTLGAALIMLRGPLWGALVALASALLLAMSSYAALTIVVGGMIWALRKPSRWTSLILVASSAIVIIMYGSLVFSPDSRIGSLLETVQAEGTHALLSDASSNARIYGIVAPVFETVRNFMLPLGMEHSAWLAMSNRIVMNNPNIYFLSENGPASGYGLIIVQAGIFGLFFVVYAYFRICLLKDFSWRGLFPAVGFAVFIGQINLSTPSFSLVMAAAIASLYLDRDDRRLASQFTSEFRRNNNRFR